MQKTLQHLFKKNTLQEIPVEALQDLTAEYPYFALGQYLLSSKLQQGDEKAFEKQFQKTLVYFHNPLWLKYQLPGKQIERQTPVLVQDAPVFSANPFLNTETQPVEHDLIEAVVLRQEADYSTPTETSDALEAAVVAPSAEITTVSKDSENQTIQRDEPFIFHAYHTVDYFASQGIKLRAEAPQADKLGKQLKSFTEWLKTMRRLPETSVVEILHKINEGEIAQIAAHSLEEKEVLTEAMAEVLVKQGKLDKARELYGKLSLLNPHKSTYFAAKIEDLK